MAGMHYWKQHRRCVHWVVGVFLCSQAALAVIVDQFADEVRDPEYSQLEGLLVERQSEKPDSPLAVFLGSSRVVHGFDATRAAGEEDVVLFNFGVPGSGPFFQGVMLDRLRKAGVKPDILFLELLHPFYNAAGPRSLDQGLLDGARLSAGEVRGLMDYGSRSRTGPLRRWAYARLLPGYRHQAEIRDRLGLGIYPVYESTAPFDGQGFRPKPTPIDERADLTRQAHISYDPFYPQFRLDESAWNRLTDMIRKARKEDITVAVVLMPEGTEFRGQYTLESETARRKMCERLQSEFGVEIVDARCWLGDSAFYDQHHLLPEGASAFADRFRTQVLRPMLAKRSR